MSRLFGRRLWLVILVGLGVAALAGGVWAFWLEPASLTVVEQRLAVGWPAPRPLRIAILTDLHVGSPFNGRDKLREVVDRTNAARPDVICILGDLVIQGVLGGRFVPPEDIAAELQRLRALSGVVGVLGNHDAWLDHDRVRRALERNGVRMLEDTSTRLETAAGSVWMAGVSDVLTGRHDIAAALATAREAGICEVVTLPDATPERVVAVFQNDAYRDRVAVFHFAGHAGPEGLLFETATGATADPPTDVRSRARTS